MLTIFTVPKPFEGHVGLIQRNAVSSWTRLRPRCQILLCGDEPGAGALASELGVELVPEVSRNRFGTPLLSSVFQAAEERAAFPLLCYVNADILLLSEFSAAVGRLAAAMPRFLMVGQRCDLDVEEELCLDDSGWEERLRARAEEAGAVHPPDGIDYFVYPRGSIGSLPPFAVGRPGWDNWMIYRARKLRLPVVDASPSLLVVHQNHDHGHVKHATGGKWEGPEADMNRELMGSGDFLFTLAEATHRLDRDGVARAPSAGSLDRLHTAVILGPDTLRRATLPVRNLLRSWKQSRSSRERPDRDAFTA